uniref:Uncharacterized protein n=1 Tax=Myotis myotis TaxID=51298 RepID=A0A7J7XHI1_MYOMY|nr:hypothetical protein mMyoMyo1_011695 [Myotis myotis]
MPWGIGSIGCDLVGCRSVVVAGPVSHLGEAKCWFVNARSVVPFIFKWPVSVMAAPALSIFPLVVSTRHSYQVDGWTLSLLYIHIILIILAKIFLPNSCIYRSRTERRDQSYPHMFGKNLSREMVIKSIGRKGFPQREKEHLI